MKINRNNYEIFIVDFLDGKLNEADKSELQTFLGANPDIWNEVQGIEEMFLKSADAISFPDKGMLIKNELLDEATFNEKAVAALEDELTKEESTEFSAFLAAESARERDFKLFEATKLKADTSVVFPDKSKLYKRTKVIPLFYYGTRVATVAAAIIIALILFNRNGSEQNKASNNNVAVVSKTENLPLNDGSDKGDAPQILVEEAENEIRPDTKIVEEVQNKTILAEANTPKVNLIENNSDNNSSEEDIFDKRTERDVLKKLEPRQPKKHKYILVVKPTLDNSFLASYNQKKPLDNVLQTGERLINSGRNIRIERSSIEKGVLNLLQLASDNRINYETNPSGKVNKINVNGELLAFSLPIRNNK